jgi:VanZ family protein
MVLTATLLSAIEMKEESTTRTAVGAVVVSSAYGVGTELLQERIPGREFEWGDLLAGVLGSVGGVLCWYWAEDRT